MMKSKSTVLIYFIKFATIIGGGEYLPLLMAAAFQKRGCQVTIAVDYDTFVSQAAELYNIPLDMCNLKVIQLKPQGRLRRKIDSIFPVFRIKQLKKLSKDADICISTLNLIDFGKPAHHFICDIQYGQFGDTAFCDYANHKTPDRNLTHLYRIIRYWFAEVLRKIFKIRSPRRIALDKREHIYPNSIYVEQLMRNFYGNINSSVFYPPTIFSGKANTEKHNPFSIKYIGRIHPLKGIIEIIKIVEKARNLTGKNLTLDIAGPLEHTSYVDKVVEYAATNDWVHLAGGVYGKEKITFLSSGTFAIHAQRDEAFGISVTEYLKAGNIVLVPDEGGSVEIVNSSALTYHTTEDAAQILSRLITDDIFFNKMREHCARRADIFSCEAYMERQRKLIGDILDMK